MLIVELDGVADAGRRGHRGASRRSAARTARWELARRTTTSSARSSGRAARPRSPRWAASAPSYYVQDGVVPRTKLPEVLRRIAGARGRARPARRQRLPRGRRQPAPARALRRRGAGRGRAGRARRAGDPRGLRRRGRLADGRARHRRRQGLRDAADVLRGRPRGDAARAPRVRPATGSRTPASSCRRRASAARCRGRTARIHSSGRALPSVSEPATVDEARGACCATRRAAGRRVSIERGRRRRRAVDASSSTVLEHEPGDLTCIVEAGMRLSALRERLAPHGQKLALDPPGDPTVGGCLAGNLSGPAPASLRRAARPRDRRRRVVLADGTVAIVGRQGRQERRRLRPRQALLRLARRASAGSRGRACGCTRCRRRRRRSSST